MAWEDLWWEIHNEITELKLKRKFDAQLSKMRTQDKHRYKDTRDKWAYAYEKVIKTHKNGRYNK